MLARWTYFTKVSNQVCLRLNATNFRTKAHFTKLSSHHLPIKVVLIRLRPESTRQVRQLAEMVSSAQRQVRHKNLPHSKRLARTWKLKLTRLSLCTATTSRRSTWKLWTTFSHLKISNSQPGCPHHPVMTPKEAKISLLPLRRNSLYLHQKVHLIKDEARLEALILKLRRCFTVERTLKMMIKSC